MNKKRTLLIPEFSSYGGTRTYFKQIVSFLYDEGFSVIVALEKEQIDNEVMDIINKYSFDIVEIKKNRSSKLAYILLRDFILLWQLKRKYKLDRIIISVGELPNYLSSFFLFKSIFYVMHTYPSNSFGNLVSLILNYKLSRERKIITVSNYSKNNIIKFWKIRDKKHDNIQVVYNFATENEIKKNDNNQTLTILTIGHLREYKNPKFWIEVAKKVTVRLKGKQLPSFVWVGDGEMFNECKKLCEGFPNIQFVGYHSDVRKFYQQAYIYFQPSLLESHGICVIDAMKYEIPCIVSDAGGLTESIQNEISGIVLKDFDVDFAADEIVNLISDKDRQSSFKKMAKIKYEHNFSKEVWLLKMQKILSGEKIYSNELFEIHNRVSSEKLPLVTVIIPTYNCGLYIKRAVDSALNQLSNIEIIIVDDASSDNTKEVLEKNYAGNHKVRVIYNKKNLKQGICRNIGLDNANGKYIFFMDADDWLQLNALEHLVVLSEYYESDIVSCGINKVWDNGATEYYHGYSFSCRGGLEAMKYYACHQIASVVWNKLYLRSFIELNKLRFNKSYGKEDVIFTLHALYKCNKVLSIHTPFYNYYQRGDSCINQIPSENHLSSYIHVYQDMLDFFEQSNMAKKNLKLCYQLLKSHCSSDVFPNLQRYFNTRTEDEWDRQCREIFYRELGLSGLAISDFLTYSFKINARQNDHNMRFSQLKWFLLSPANYSKKYQESFRKNVFNKFIFLFFSPKKFIKKYIKL